MASCDVFSCIRNIFISEEEYAKKAEENAKTLSQVFRSHVIESQCSLEEALRNARCVLSAYIPRDARFFTEVRHQ